MNNNSNAVFSLQCDSAAGEGPVLLGVDAEGRIDDLTFGLTIRQRYANRSSQVLEVVYTFPLPARATLLGFASELNGQRQSAVIVASEEADDQYEQALAAGDAPVMLEDVGGGVHTANIGNLKPGDELMVEVRLASFVDFESGRLRIAIPSTIAPRYGDPSHARLQPQQVPEVSLTAEYPLSLSLRVEGVLSAAAIACPTHPASLDRRADQAIIRLALGACLDRDAVFTIEPPAPIRSRCLSAVDPFAPEAAVVRVASFELPAREPRPSVALKVLVDCSGSMAGDSIASARVALREFLQGVSTQDVVSISRFGSTVDHPCRPARMTPAARQRALASVDALAADMGGTEMEGALESVFQLESTLADRVDVLLITDGEIWASEGVVHAARASGHRVFAIGVGSAPAEGVLRDIAEQSGGACEFATPGESLEAAARRMLALIRQDPLDNLSVDWGAPVLWQTPVPAICYGGQTLRLACGLAPRDAAALRVRLQQRHGAEAATLADVAVAPATSGSDAAEQMVRLAARRRLDATVLPEERQVLALRYQLLCEETKAVLIHERAATARTDEAARLVRVASMLPAGAFGMSIAAGTMCFAEAMAPAPSTPAAWKYRPSDLRLCADGGEMPEVPVHGLSARDIALLQEAADTVWRFIDQGGELARLADECRDLLLPAFVRSAVKTLTGQTGDAAVVWLVVAHWWCNHAQAQSRAQLSVRWQDTLDRVPVDVLARGSRLLDNSAAQGHLPTRSARLHLALAG